MVQTFSMFTHIPQAPSTVWKVFFFFISKACTVKMVDSDFGSKIQISLRFFFLNRTKSMHFFCQSVLESKSSFSALARTSYLNASRDLVRKWFWKWVKVTLYLEYCTTFTAAPPAVSVLAPTDVLFLLLSPTYQVQFQQLSSWHFRTESQSRSKSRNCLGKSNPFSAIQFTTPTLL